MNVDDRIRKVLNSCEFTTEEISLKTDIKYGRWTTIRKTGGTARAYELEALCKLFPDYALWLSTGRTMPEVGQINPELEETSNNYGKTGTDTK